MSVSAQLDQLLIDTFTLAGYEPQAARAVRSQRADLADYQCNGAMAAAKTAGKPPRAIAEDIAERLKARTDLFSDVSVAGPGFINLRLQDGWIGERAGALLDDPKQGYDPATHKPRKVIIDFGGPNIAKEMHAGHLRTAILGESLQRILRFLGDHVVSDVHFGDWGTPMGMIIAELEREQPGLPYFDPAITTGYPSDTPIDIEGLSELYRRASTRFKEDEAIRKQAREVTDELQRKRPGYYALWQHFRTVTFEAVKRNYDRLGIHFDWWLGESDTADMLRDMVEELKRKGIAVESEGAIVIPSPKGTPEKPEAPLILEKSDGGFTYGTTDIATIIQRVRDFAPQLELHVVDNRQSQYFELMFHAAKIAGYAPGVDLRHISYGTINGKDGKPFKTREGGVMRLEELLDIAHARAMEELPEASESGMNAEALNRLADQISVAAIKFQDLKNNRLSDYIFDVDSFAKFEGKTGPYLQYAVVRCNAILAKAGAPPVAGSVAISNAAERSLVLELLAFPAALNAAVAGFEPSLIAEHAFSVAQAYSTFYASSPVLNESDPDLKASRLRLVAVVRRHMTLCLDLLGIEAPEMMPSRKSTI